MVSGRNKIWTQTQTCLALWSPESFSTMPCCLPIPTNWFQSDTWKSMSLLYIPISPTAENFLRVRTYAFYCIHVSYHLHFLSQQRLINGTPLLIKTANGHWVVTLCQHSYTCFSYVNLFIKIILNRFNEALKAISPRLHSC